MMEVLTFSVGAVAVIRGIVEVAKRLGLDGSRYAAALELVLGVGFVESGIAAGALTIAGVPAGAPMDFFGVFYGCTVGLAAAGLYQLTSSGGEVAAPVKP